MRRRPDVISDAELQARAAELATPPPSEIEQRLDAGLLIVSAGGQRLGIPVSAAHAVVLRPVITAIPLAPPLVAGVINLHGEIVAALDLARLLGVASPNAAVFAVIVRRDDLVAALLVDDVDDVDVDADRQGVTVVDLAAVLNHPQLLPFRSVTR